MIFISKKNFKIFYNEYVKENNKLKVSYDENVEHFKNVEV
jgi:hypothetical protein